MGALAVDETPCVFLQEFSIICHGTCRRKVCGGECGSARALREQGRSVIQTEKNGVHDEVLTFPHNPNGADANVKVFAMPVDAFLFDATP